MTINQNQVKIYFINYQIVKKCKNIFSICNVIDFKNKFNIYKKIF